MIRKLSIGLLACLLITVSVMAQDMEHQNVICLNTGASLIGIFAGFDTGGKSFSKIPIQLTYDRMVTDRISVGGAFSYQKMGVSYSNDSIFDVNGTLIKIEDFTTTAQRLNFAVRGLFHYVKVDNFDLYSGLRIGATYWDLTTTSSDPTYDPVTDLLNKLGTTLFSPQLILIGTRYYFVENIGVNAEFAIGSPSFFSVGLSARF